MSKRTQGKQAKRDTTHVVVMVLCAMVAALAVAVGLLLARPTKVVANFEQCKAEGGAILEVYPEICKLGDATFTNNAQSVIDETYVGMTEAAALAKAQDQKTPARVVERDGKALPVTMDFAFGRYNLYVRDGKVYKVEVEGQGTDLPLNGN